MTRMSLALALLALTLLALTLTAGWSVAEEKPSTIEVETPKGDVTVTTEEAAAVAGTVIESSLRGVGQMIGALRGGDPESASRAEGLRTHGAGAPLTTSYLPVTAAIRCAGNERIEVVERHVRDAVTAVEAHGNCRVRLTGVHLLAGATAVVATGNAEVVIENSFVQGAPQALKVTGNAEVRYRDSTLRGGIFAAAGGRAVDEGGNAVEVVPDPVSAPLAPEATLRCGERERVVLLHRRVDSASDGIEVAPGCALTLSDSYVRAGGWGLRIARGGRATVRNSVIEAEAGGIEVADGGVLHVAGSSIPGGLRVVGDATAIDGGGNAWAP